ncbi:hypothetical protein HYN59_13890 [Flavobacterium album]|uniref:CpXC domain-containing protein n=1 Tax=Flavobacterium album TaxID=2175091 RepID=A0A2S1R0J7_9FLAO|nr:hypothetical protein [Flavobacterium album]AWH86134.1 hypothetical protein HYN59_13890 [Flavobacterium album]
MEYTAEKVCKECGAKDIFELTKTEAAFSLKDSTLQNSKCTNCGSERWNFYAHNRPDLDTELLEIWGNDPNIYFMDQDEDIVLAEEENIPLFLNAIDNKLYPQRKLNILLAALCIIVYDNVAANEEYTDEENIKRKKIADKVIPELSYRKHLIDETKNWEIMDYIRKVVFPLIGLNKRK